MSAPIIVVATPTRGILYTESVQALEKNCAQAKLFPVCLRTHNLPVDEARTKLWKDAVNFEWDYMLMLDDDVVMPDGALSKMIEYLVENDLKVVACEYPVHYDPVYASILGEKPCTVTAWEQWDGTSRQGKNALWTGLGCCLVTKEAYEIYSKAVEIPFRCQSSPVDIVGEEKRLVMRFAPDEENALKDKDGGGEDGYFYFLLTKHGIPWGVHPTVLCDHLRINTFVSWLSNGRYQRQQEIGVSSSAVAPYNLQLFKEQKEKKNARS